MLSFAKTRKAHIAGAVTVVMYFLAQTPFVQEMPEEVRGNLQLVIEGVLAIGAYALAYFATYQVPNKGEGG